MRRLHTSFMLAAFALTICVRLASASVEVDRWLVTDAVDMPHALIDSVKGYDPVKELFEHPPLDAYDYWPDGESTVTLAPGETVAFHEGALDFSAPKSGSEGFRAAYAASYLACDNWQKGSLKVTGRAPFKLFYDGEELLGRATAAAADTTDMHKDITLDQGTHRLLLLTAASGSDSLESWKLAVSYEAADSTMGADYAPTSTTDPKHLFDIIDYTTQQSVGGLTISPDGRWLAVRIAERDRKTMKGRSYLSVWDLKTKKEVWSYGAPVSPSVLTWSPDSRRLLLGLKEDDGTNLYLLSTENWLLRETARDVQDLGSVVYAPDGKGFYYTRSIEPKKDDRDYKVMWGIEDRWAGWRNQIEFRYFAFDSDSSMPIARGKYGPDAFDVSKDGSTLVAYRMIPAEGRPYGKLQLWTVPTAGGAANLVTTLRMTRNLGLAISPDGKHVAFGGPYEETLADSDPETTHNPSNCYLWIVDLNTGEARNVSRDLEGDVNDGAYGTGGNSDFVWGDDGILRFTAFSFGTVLYCTYDPKRDELETRHLGTPGFANLAIPTDGKANVVAYRADHLEDYSNVDWYDLKRNRGGTLITLGEKLRRITTPNTKVVPFDYVNSDGVTIPGYLRYPAGYDDTKSYPMIVDTYGGVIGFGAGWMWTNSYFANRGYFDYIVVPRGASGYGQAFSDGHEGEWGATTSKDINQGVRAVISQIAGVDSTRVAWDSGSYGGFLAMYLLSMPKDDPNYFPYATAVGGYGISDIANYWGIGNWGQWYMEVSAPGKLPWSDPQWFIEHSPIYRADNITAPLLLVHGDADVNVPVGNSDEMYTALETLNRNVTFVRWPGEGHGTARDRKHYLERKRIEMEWFDKWLRDRPGAFEERTKDDMQK